MSRGKRKYFFVAQSTKECGDCRGAWAPSGFQQDVAHITQSGQAGPDSAHTSSCLSWGTHTFATICKEIPTHSMQRTHMSNKPEQPRYRKHTAACILHITASKKKKNKPRDTDSSRLENSLRHTEAARHTILQMDLHVQHRHLTHGHTKGHTPCHTV